MKSLLKLIKIHFSRRRKLLLARTSFILGALILLANTTTPCSAIDTSTTIAYKLAQIQENNSHPEKYLMAKNSNPPNSLVTEFQWLLDSIKNRSINPENAIADTFVEVWSALKQLGSRMTLIEVARELNRTAEKAATSGGKKINFRMTSSYWLKAQMRQ